jgi:hypothetical protein
MELLRVSHNNFSRLLKDLNLTIKERLLFPVLFPEKADKLTQIICDGIEKKVGITAEEVEKYKIESIPNGWKWDGKFDEETFPVELSESEAAVLKDQSRRLDLERSITRQMLCLIKKIDAL